MKEHAFYPDHIIEQIKTFFSDVHDITGFYYKMYLLNGLCRQCDGRGYLHTPDQACPHCQASGNIDRWRRPIGTKATDGVGPPGQKQIE